MARARRLRPLDREVAAQLPALADPAAAIAAGRVLVGGMPITNPRSLVPVGAALSLARERTLRGEAKLQAGLEAFALDVRGRVALDLGAAAGGFTRVLLSAGARRVYAVDAGHGQLLGSLRLDARVVVHERTNLAQLDAALVPEAVDVVVLDLSYLAIARAAGQLGGVAFAPDADLVALVKPMYELGLDRPPPEAATRQRAVAAAAAGLRAAGWEPLAAVESPAPGARGAVEQLLHARRAVPLSRA